MASTFFGLDIAYTGLLSANAALNTTANNISNSETEGYSKQVVKQQAREAIRTFTTYGCAGAGVDTIAIERMRDEFYDEKYWNCQSQSGEYSTQYYYMKQIETYFTDSTTIKGFTTVFNEMMDSLAEVKKNSGDTTTKAQFIGYVNNLCQYFNNLSGELTQLQKDANDEIKVKVDEINSIAESITTFNKQINVIEMNGGNANELRDQRTLLLDKLSEIANIETQEQPIYDGNGNVVDGAKRFIIKMAGGQTLVDGYESNELVCVPRDTDEKVNQSDLDGLYDVYWKDGNTAVPYSDLLGGSLAGLYQIRDGNNAENFTGTVSKIVGNQVTVDVTADYLKDLNKCTLSDTGGKIKFGNQTFYYDSFTYKYDKTTTPESYSYTFTINEEKSEPDLLQSMTGKEANVGASINYQGIPYYMEQMNEWIRVFASTYNGIQQNGYNEKGTNGSLLLTGGKKTDNTQYELDTEYQTGTTGTVSSTDDSYYQLTASNVAVFAELFKDADLLATKSSNDSGTQEDYDVITKMIEAVKDKSVMNFRNSSASEFLTCLLSDVALNTSRVKNFSSSYEVMGKTIDNQRLSVSGVDKDEEALSLVKYQNAYTLASKMIQTFTEVYDRLILETGV